MIKCTCGGEECSIKVRFDVDAHEMLVDGLDDGAGISVMFDANGIVEMVHELRKMLNAMLEGKENYE